MLLAVTAVLACPSFSLYRRSTNAKRLSPIAFSSDAFDHNL
jgi:hypothetical protein